jgi:ribonuclease R
LPDRVIPMLPEKISNDLCSLNPNTKKLSLSCEVLIDKSGKIVSKKVYESIISSKFRLTYKEVQKIINNEQ